MQTSWREGGYPDMEFQVKKGVVSMDQLTVMPGAGTTKDENIIFI